MEKWEKYLINTKQKNVNIERCHSIKEIKSNLVHKYILKCLEILDSMDVGDYVYKYVSDTIKWSDVSKCGSSDDRKKWQKLGFPLNIHNIASAMIYRLDNKDYDEITYVLIKTHGLIGQYIRGEIKLSNNSELYGLISKGLISKESLHEILVVLNKCIMEAVDSKLYEKLSKQVDEVILRIINNDMEEDVSVFDRLNSLNSWTLKPVDILNDKKVEERLKYVFDRVELWYYEAALGNFDITEQIKILLIVANYIEEDTRHLTFESIMKKMYLDYDKKKVINIYKKRIIECMLNEMQVSDILSSQIADNAHVSCVVKRTGDTISFDFKFSKQAIKLIEFCEVAYTSNSLYNKSVYMLYELFGFRRDQYDRFYNEIDYLNTMNSSMDNKKVLVDFINGKSILDVGPGGGALMNIIEEAKQDSKVYGIDISKNVIEELTKKKISENHDWTLIEGDALSLNKYFESGVIDTIIYSSIIHELYSYISFNGKKFNIETVIEALKSADSVLKSGGRIIIRDGIKTEPENQYRLIKFKNKNDMTILDNYCRDFKGRCVTYERIDSDTVKMLVNDAMEFLYTYTWGENSYSLEVKEQFGYLTPSEYIKLIEDNLKGYKVIFSKAFLQDGYEENLLNKISIYDEDGSVVKLPNSTFILVIEKE